MKTIFTFLMFCFASFGFAQTYVLVSDATQLANGGTYVLVGVKNYELYVLNTQNANNRSSTATGIVFSEEGASIPSSVDLLNVEHIPLEISTIENSSFWSLKDTDSNMYLYAAGTGNQNYLKSQSQITDRATWEITFNENQSASIIAQTDATERKKLRYNASGSYALFSCYASGQTDVYIYKLLTEDGGEDTTLEPSISLNADLSTFTYVAGEGPSSVQSLLITGENVQNDLEITVAENFQISLSESEDFSNAIIINAYNGEELNVYVRLKSELQVGAYNGDLIISTEGLQNIVLPLNGIVEDIPAFIQENNLDEMVIYPNPTTDKVFFGSKVNVVLYDVLGKQLSSKNQVDTIDLTTYPVGLYIVKFTDGNETKTIKIIKK